MRKKIPASHARKPARKAPNHDRDELELLSNLRPDPKNARTHSERNVDTIVAALQEVGTARSIVVDEKNIVLAGNATLEAAAKAGISRVRVIDVGRDTLVAVRRSDLSPAAKTRLALFDNRAAELAGWDVDVLREFVDKGGILDGLFSTEELAALLAGADQPGRTDPDSVPALRKTKITRGDYFALGRHRLLCGDSTNADDVARVLGGAAPALMVTDPPYGVKYDPSWRRAAGVNKSDRMGAVTNDDRADWSDAWLLSPASIAYVWHAGVFASVVSESLTKSAFTVRSQIIWRKNRIVLSRGHYHWQHEPCWYAVRHGRSARWSGKRNQSTVWPIAMPLHRCQSCGAIDAEETIDELPSTVWDIAQKDATGETTHGTQKPVECMARPMRNHDVLDVYEPFCGSGSTLIAAEMLGRSCYAIELDPSYVQQIVDRWEAFTGEKSKPIAGPRGR